MQHTHASPWADGDPPGYSPPRASPRSSDELPRLVLGAVLAGRYRVLTQAGAGTHGTVYRAKDERTGQTVAIKCQRRGQGQKEAAFLGGLSHPKLPTLFEVVSGDTSAYLVMEWIEGVYGFGSPTPVGVPVIVPAPPAWLSKVPSF